MHKTAVVSDDKIYRYYLTREWEAPRWDPMVFCMLNPSTADASIDDPTIRRCMGFAKREKCTGIIVVNLYSLRATNPRELAKHPDPIGPRTQHFWESAARAASFVVLAWGNNALWERGHCFREFLKKWNTRAVCLGKTLKGEPKHPLYIKADAPLLDFYSGEKYIRTVGV